MDKFAEKTLDSEYIYNGNIVRMQVDDVLLPDGKTSKREIIKHPGAVAVIPVTEEGKIICVEQYRKPLEKSIIEIPAGKMEAEEQPEVTARRELEEETGYTAGELDFVTSFYTSPGFADELMQIYIAKSVTPMAEKTAGDDDEFIAVHLLTLEEAKTCIAEKRMHDAKTNYAIMYLEQMGGILR